MGEYRGRAAIKLLEGELALAPLTLTQQNELDEDLATLQNRDAPQRGKREAVARILAAAASRINPQITPEQVASMIDASNQIEALNAALGVAGIEKASTDRPT